MIKQTATPNGVAVLIHGIYSKYYLTYIAFDTERSPAWSKRRLSQG